MTPDGQHPGTVERVESELSARKQVTDRRISPVETALFFTAFVAATQAFGLYLFPALASDIRETLALDEGAVGLISGAGQAGNAAFAVFSTFVIPRLGAGECLFLFVSVTMGCQVAFSFLHDELAMAAFMFLIGGCAAAVWVTIMVACQSLIPEDHRAKALGLMSSGTSFGLFLNGLLLPTLLAHGGWRLPWLVFAGITAVILVLAVWRLWPILDLTARARTDADADTHKGVWRQVNFSPAAGFAVVLLFGCALCLVPFQTYLSLLLREGVGWSVKSAAFAWSVMGVGGMIGGVVLGAIADRTSIKWTLALTFLALAFVAPVPLVYSSQQILVYVAVVLFGMGYFALFGLLAAYITKMCPPEVVPTFSGISFVAVGLGGMAGNFAGGQILELGHGFFPLYLGIALLSGVLAAIASLKPADKP